MKHIILLIVLLSISPSLSAQSLGEDAYIRFYLGRSVQSSKLFAENGLGKFLLFKNVPAHWVDNYQRSNSLTDVHGLFGEVTPQLSRVRDNSFWVDMRGSSLGEVDLSFRGTANLKKVTAQLSLNGHWGNTKNDHNYDNYLDLDLKKRFFLFNSWSIYLTNFTSINRVYFLGMETQGGRVDFDKELHYLGNQVYGYGMGMTHLVGESTNYIAAREKDMAIINFRVIDHTQNDYYGQRQYAGKEWGMQAGAEYTYVLENGFDMFKFGLNYEYKRIRESLDTLKLQRLESFGGGFVGYETSFGKKVKLSTRANILYHNLAGWVFVPRMKIDFKIYRALSANVFGGSGMRYANVLSENQQFLISNRAVNVFEELQAERAWYYGASIKYNQWIRLGLDFLMTANLQFYHTIYQDKVILDLDSSAYQMNFYNLDGQAEKISFELDVQFQFTRPRIGLNVDYRLDFVNETINGEYRQAPFQSMHTLLIGIDYRMRIAGFWVLDLNTQLYWYSPQRLPDVSAKNSWYGLQSDAVTRWDMRIDLPLYSWIRGRSKWKNFTITVGIDNIADAVHPLPFISYNQSFAPSFDAGMAWQSTVGRRIHAGFTYKFK